MISKQRIHKLFGLLNDALKQEGEVGEIGVIGGTVMCLVYNAREATRDVDAVFMPAPLIRKLVARIAEDEKLPADWLNDAAKGFLQPGFQRQTVLELSHLRVWAPQADYMLAMKCISARWDGSDKDDVRFLIRHLALKKPKQVFALIEKYYPRQKIPPKTQFLIEELMETSVA
jgi:hypothetical protein